MATYNQNIPVNFNTRVAFGYLWLSVTSDTLYWPMIVNEIPVFRRSPLSGKWCQDFKGQPDCALIADVHSDTLCYSNILHC